MTGGRTKSPPRPFSRGPSGRPKERRCGKLAGQCFGAAGVFSDVDADDDRGNRSCIALDDGHSPAASEHGDSQRERGHFAAPFVGTNCHNSYANWLLSAPIQIGVKLVATTGDHLSATFQPVVTAIKIWPVRARPQCSLDSVCLLGRARQGDGPRPVRVYDAPGASLPFSSLSPTGA